jgi:serine protease Do
MAEQVKTRWIKGLALTVLPLIVIAVGVVAVAADEDDKGRRQARTYWVGERDDSAYLGVSIEEETEHEEGGARVTRVVEGSPAEKAGVEKGDIIIGFEAETIRGPVGLTKQIRTKEPGDTVAIIVLRDGSRQTLTAELGDRSDRWTVMVEPRLRRLEEMELPEINEQVRDSMRRLAEAYTLDCEEGEEDCGYSYRYSIGWPRRAVLGVQLVEVTPELREHLGAEEGTGVLVSKVLQGTPAENAGVHVGDLIVAVDGEEISTSVDLRRALQGKAGETFDVQVIRDRTPMSLEVTIPEPERDRPTGPRAAAPPRPDRPARLRSPRVVVAPAVPEVPTATTVVPVAPEVQAVPVAPAAPEAGVEPVPVAPATPRGVVDAGRPAEREAQRVTREARRAQTLARREYERALRLQETRRNEAERARERAQDRARRAYERALRLMERQQTRQRTTLILL